MKKVNVVFDLIFVIMLLFFLVCDAIFVYYKWFSPKKTTTGDINLSLIDTPDGKIEFCEVNMYENSDNSGIALFEIKFNYHVNQEDNQIHTSGLQILGEPKSEYVLLNSTGSIFNSKAHVTSQIVDNIYYYKMGKTLSYTSSSKYAYDESFKVNINDVSYNFQFYREMSRESSSLFITNVYYSSPWEFAKSIYSAIKNNKIGVGYNSFEFKDMFTVSVLNDQGKYVSMDDVDTIMSHLYIKVNHYLTGAKTYEDSLFKRIQDNSNFSVEGATSTSDYFADKSFYKITENDFIFNYDNTLDGHAATLNVKCFDYINHNKIKNLEIVLDNDYLKSINVILKQVNSSYLTDLGLSKYTLIENQTKSEVSLNVH